MQTDPPDTADSITDGLQTVSYAQNSQGQLEQVKGQGWQPVNDVNRQAWREIEKQIEQARSRVVSGRASCLYYYMIANQMSITLLARYSGQSSLRVRLHLIPFFFRRLTAGQLQRYADLFQISSRDLKKGALLPAVYSSAQKHG